MLLLLNMESTVDYGPRTATKSSSSGLCGKLNRIECMLITNLCIAYAIITIINSQIGLNFGIFYEIGYLALTFYGTINIVLLCLCLRMWFVPEL